VGNLARVYGPEAWAVYERLDRSLDPRGPESMLDVAAAYLSSGDAVLDIGCRDGAYLVELVRRTGARGTGVDPVGRFGDPAGAGVRFDEGVMEALPYGDNEFDLVWCRDVVEGVEPLDAAFAEAARVLRPGGRMVLYTVFATDRLEPGDENLLAQNLVVVRASLEEDAVEAAFGRAGFEIEREDVVGTEWREFDEERTQPVSRDLLRLARLRRQHDEVVAEVGEELAGHIEANLHWLAFLLLGKLRPTLYVLRRL
jgi:SAM-dependent methyltransferase